MKKNIKLLAVLILILVCFIAFRIYGQQGNFVQCEINNCTYESAYLLAIRGTQNTPLDSTQINGSKFRFEMKENYPKGMYRLLLNDSTYISFVYNFESVSFKVNNSIDIETLEVMESKENQIFYKYLKNEFACSDIMNGVISEAQDYYSQGQKKYHKEIDSLRNLITEIDHEKRVFSLKLADKNPNLFTSNIIKAMQVPSYAEYKKKNKEDRYGSEMNFLSIHYFDYIDFKDTALLNTEVVYRSFSTYLRNFARPANTQGLIRASDMMLAKAAENINFYDYVLELLIGTFENSQWTDVYTYLVKNHLPNDTLGNDWAINAQEKAEIFMKLTPGNIAPQVIGVDLKGRDVNLNDMEAKATLIVFWSADCDHCVQSMPKLKAVTDNYMHEGLEIIAVSIDIDQMLWRNTVKKLGLLNWFHIIEPKGIESKLLEDYNVSVTPTFFLLDGQKKIVSCPIDENEMKKDLKRLFKN